MGQLQALQKQKEQLIARFNDPAILADPAKLKALSQKISHLEAQIARIRNTSQTGRRIKGVLLEVRAGTGGQEAAIFAKELFRMYERFAQKQGWQVKVLNVHPTDLGGYREAILEIKSPQAWELLRHEAGTHRIQRIPATEKAGRIHTSTATVALLPEPEELKITIKPEDLRIDTYRSSGKGGQHVNVTDSAVRITHLPTGLVATSQAERSQHQNRARAMKILQAKLYQLEQTKLANQQKTLRKSAVGTAARPEKIRTYNFPQDRLTDHRLNKSWHNLEEIMEGNLEPIISALAGLEE